MERERAITRYRGLYAKLLRLYPKPYRDRFEEPMRQTFHDLCRERIEAGHGLFGFVLWLFVETSVGIIREDIKVMMMKSTTKRLSVWAVVVALLLMIPLVAMQFTEEVNWDLSDFFIMGCLLFGVGLAYELIARRSEKTVYRVACALGLAAALLLCWVNGAVGIIGNEGNPANLMYAGVFLAGVVGAFVARLRSNGMALTLFVMAIVQLSVPVIALLIWPPRTTSWGAADVSGVFVFNAFFAALFFGSALLFRHAARERAEGPA